jgi:indolepyruvate ferredoxin oxidoreductase alpha subunit
MKFAKEKEMIFLIEEGAPSYLEEAIRSILHSSGISIQLFGKEGTGNGRGFIPMTGGLDVDALIEPLTKILSVIEPYYAVPRERFSELMRHRERAVRESLKAVVRRNPTFCTGCPERPIFSAIKWLDEKFGRSIYAGDIGCYTMAKLPPFGTSDSCTGMGTSLDVALGLSQFYKQRVIAVMGDGTFFHRGVTDIDNVMYNITKETDVNIIFVIFENYWTAMTGHQPNPATKADSSAGSNVNYRGEQASRPSIESVLKIHGVTWVKKVNPFDFYKMLETMLDAYSENKGLRVVICDGECTLARTRRELPIVESKIAHRDMVKEVKYKIDEDICSGCFPCEKYSGCPSVTVVKNPNPLRTGYIKQTEETCTGCGVCGITSIFGLCPSTYRVTEVHNPSPWQRLQHKVSQSVIAYLRGDVDG